MGLDILAFVVPIILILVVVVIFLSFVPLGLWISAISAGVKVSIFSLVGMRLRRVRADKIIRPLIKAQKAGMNVNANQLESHLLSGGRVDNVVDALIAAHRANLDLSFERAAGLITGSKRKFIVTSRANSCVGDMLLLLLKHLLPDVYETSHPALNVIDHLCDITENDCIVAVSFPRYSEMDLLAAQMAYEAGAKIVLITDKASSPLAKYATQLLTVSVDSNTFFNSYVAVLFTIELLCSFISKKMGYSTEAKLQLIDKYLSKVGLF